MIYLTPQGNVFTQSLAEELAGEKDLVFLCGHYEGIDERVLEEVVTDYVSIGDYVLTGGELPAMVMIDAISRLVPGVLNNQESAQFECVPPVLLSGHHGNVDQWRREQSLKRTLERRPDLLETADLTEKDRKYLNKLLANMEET